MKTYQFEFTNQRYTSALFALSFLGFATVIFTSGYTEPLIGLVPVILLAFVVAVAVFLLNKRKIRQKGSVTIADTYVEFKLPTLTRKIEYKEISRYEFKKFYTGRLLIKLKNGEKFLLVANPNFCKPDGLIGVSILLESSFKN